VADDAAPGCWARAGAAARITANARTIAEAVDPKRMMAADGLDMEFIWRSPEKAHFNTA
jgi:hypothetical protein